MKKSELVQMIREEIQAMMRNNITELEKSTYTSAADKRAHQADQIKWIEPSAKDHVKAVFGKYDMPASNKVKNALVTKSVDLRNHASGRDARIKNASLAKTTGAPSTNFQNAASGIKVKNPITGKEILATSAYSAGPQHPAYNAAKTALKKEIVNLRHK